MGTVWEPLLLLIAAGMVGGAMNAAGGGGSFITLPCMIVAGVPPVSANASSTVALFPGSVASTWATRNRLAPLGGVSLRVLLAVTAAGGLAGGVLLVITPEADFQAVIPWLLLIATVTFALGRRTGTVVRQRVRVTKTPLLAAQFVLGVYGGYFGGAVGILMMAVWSLLSPADLRVMNPLKTLMVAAARAIAVLLFIAATSVAWLDTVPVLVAAVAGGYLGAWGAQHINPMIIRIGIITVMTAIIILFFLGVPSMVAQSPHGMSGL